MFHPLRQVGNQKRRRVSREDRIRPADGLELRDDVSLDVEVLENGFDHEVGGCQLRPVGRPRDPLPDRLGVVGLEDLP
jgi:hypothetical protein